MALAKYAEEIRDVIDERMYLSDIKPTEDRAVGWNRYFSYESKCEN